MSDPFTPSAELAAIATRWLNLHARRQTNASANLFSNSNAVTLIGSDESEIIAGPGFRNTFKAFFEDDANLITEDIQATGYEAGDFGWAWTTLTVRAPDAGKSVKFRNSFVFVMEDGVWRIVHVHNSNPTPNTASMGYSARNLEDLVASVEAERPDLGHTGMSSVMFTDIVDSTAIAAVMGDAWWSQTVKRHFDQIAETISGYGGTLVKSLGDGTLCAFPTASGALGAAIGIQKQMSAYQSEPPLRLRIGLHTGDVVEKENDYLGGVVNKAARIAASAHPNEIRLSEATRVVAGGGHFAYSDPIVTTLKGLEGDHIVHRLEWADAQAP